MLLPMSLPCLMIENIWLVTNILIMSNTHAHTHTLITDDYWVVKRYNILWAEFECEYTLVQSLTHWIMNSFTRYSENSIDVVTTHRHVFAILYSFIHSFAHSITNSVSLRCRFRRMERKGRISLIYVLLKRTVKIVFGKFNYEIIVIAFGHNHNPSEAPGTGPHLTISLHQR